MNELFYTPLNRSRRFARGVQFYGTLFMLIAIFYSIIIMVLLIKGMAETGSWVSILMLMPCLPAYCYMISKAIWPTLLRPFVRIRFNKEGVLLIRPLCKDNMLPWGTFQEVCLIDDDIAIGSRRPPASLLLVKWEAPKTRRGNWNNNSMLHPDRIISVDYDAELRAALRELCPHPIVDHRKHLNGKHSAA